MSAYGDPFAPGLLRRLDQPVRKVVVLRASRIGDFLCTIPALRALRAALPDAQIALVTLPMLRELAERVAYVDHYAAFPGFPGLAEQLFDARAAVRFFAAMQAEAFDLALQMQGSGVNSNPFTLLLGARATAGFVRAGDTAGRLDAALAWPETGHEIERMLALTTFIGAPPCGRRTDFALWPEDHARADALLAGRERPLIGIHAGARDTTRRWPAERFAAAARELRRRNGGTLVWLGDEGERPLAEAVAARAGAGSLNLAGRTSLPVLAAVIARLDLLLTNDTGPAHIAYALDTPSVTIFGGASPEAYGPPPSSTRRHRVVLHPVACRPRNGSTCATCAFDVMCLDRVRVADVLAAAQGVLGSRRGAAGWHEGATIPLMPQQEPSSDVASL